MAIRLVLSDQVTYVSKSNQQFGFMTGRSSLQLLLFMNNILEAKACSNSVYVVYLDFRKPFDSVPHNELLYKLWKHGITGKIMPIMLALSLMLLHTYYAKNYAGIIDSGLYTPKEVSWAHLFLYCTLMTSQTLYPRLYRIYLRMTPNVYMSVHLRYYDINALHTYSNSWHLLFHRRIWGGQRGALPLLKFL